MRDEVYERHAARVRGEQGTLIQQIKDFGKEIIPEEDARRMNCATFEDFELIWMDVKHEANIRIDRVYGALRLIGYNARWHQKTIGGDDPLGEVGELIRLCERSRDRDIKLMAKRRAPLFTDVRSIKIRIDKDTHGHAVNDAEDAGIQTSHLNLYLALTGVEALVENEPAWIERRDDDDIIDILRMKSKAARSLLHQRTMLRGVLGQ